MMNETTRMVKRLRCAPTDDRQAFSHRLRIGLVIAAIILLGSVLW